MSKKDANDNAYPLENGNDSGAAQALPIEEEAASESLDSVLEGKCKKKGNESIDLNTYLPPYESPLKKEDNPFSFKKFLNQDSLQKNKGARKKIFTPTNSNSSENSDISNHRPNRVFAEVNSRISPSDMSSVLPDFVQDHLVIEQCYLSGSSSDIDINNLNFQNLPDLNLEHRKVHFMLNNERNMNHSDESLPEKLPSNLPDFTFGASNFQSVTQTASNNKRLPDFAVHAKTDSDDDIDLSNSRRNIEINNDTSQSSRPRVQISSSPSVPLDLPSYENDESSQNLPIPFDLTAPAEEKNSSCRGRASNEAVSKSLPDFLSDGPIKKEMDDNLQNFRGGMQNSLSSDDSPIRMEDRLHREINLLRCQLMEKNRRVERLERELEHLHSTDQRETASLEYALQEVEKNLKQTAKRALNAESTVQKLIKENKTLNSEISSLKSENVMLRLGNYNSQSSPSQEVKNQKIAKELRAAAKQAESSLKFLLMGVENLRGLADTMENAHKFQNANKDIQDFSNEDSASGPAS